MPARRSVEDREAAFTGGQLKTAPTTLTVAAGSSSTTPAALAPGTYQLAGNTSVWLRQVNANTVGVDATNGHYLPLPYLVASVSVDGDGDQFIAAMGVLAGTITISRR